jgi:transglutaminase-like putative cysteine protease
MIRSYRTVPEDLKTIEFLMPTPVFDWNNNSVSDKVQELTEGLLTNEEQALALFYFVRDEIKYKLFDDELSIEQFRSSETLKNGYGFCIPKAGLLISFARATGIPARLHLVDIRNHRLPEHIFERLKTDLLVYHGYAELYLNDRWIAATPAMDIALCEKYQIIPVEFDGRKDAMFHKKDKEDRLDIEYVSDHGTFHDLPYDRVMSAFKQTYR